MAYIYKIENQINHKVYIGKTVHSIEHRWSQHLRECVASRAERRPLYIAMNKYGTKNFSIEMLEECSADNSAARERYWIAVYNSYQEGYNATFSGDGKQYADYDLIYNLYSEGYDYKKIIELTGYDRLTIATALDEHGILLEERRKRAFQRRSKQVARLDKVTGDILEILPSTAEADRRYKTGKHVAEVCNGKRKTAGGYGWKYV